MPSYPINAADGLCADAAQAAALCTSVIRSLQLGLTKAAPHAAESCPALTTHRVFRCLITSQRLTDSWPPRTVVHLVTRATLDIVAAGVNGIFTTGAVPEKLGHRVVTDNYTGPALLQ